MTGILVQLLVFLLPLQVTEIGTSGGRDIQIVDYTGLEEYLSQYDDRAVVVNFWATWCVPCVRELPYFEEVTKTYSEEDLVVVLVSLDFTKQIDTRLKPFLKKHQLQSKVILLDDPDQNVWINKVDPEWSGAIPMTIVRKDGKQKFYEGSFDDYHDLNTFIQSFINS